MTDPIEISRWNWDGQPRIHSGAPHFAARHSHYCTFDWASAAGRETAILEAAQ
jgi:hypothetical protein